MQVLAEDDGVGKLIGFVVVALIWGLSAFASMVKKANEQAKRNAIRRAPSAIPVPPRMPTAHLPQVHPHRAMAALPPTLAQRAEALTHGVSRSQASRPHAAVALPAPVRVPRPVAAAPVETVIPPVTSRPVVRGADAAAIRRWLRPATLRQQFILTELLHPPIALREKSAIDT